MYIFMIVLDNIIDLIFSKPKQIDISINSKNISEFIPKIYYIGEGKTGSSCLKTGFSNVNVAHWHSVSFFEKIYRTKLLTNNNYDLYDLILYIGNKYNFKPIIIESTRNPIIQRISEIFQHIKLNRGCGPNCTLCKIKKTNDVNAITKLIKEYLLVNGIQKDPYSIKMYKKHFDIDLLSSFDNKLNYYFNNTNNCYLLFLKYENITEWPKIINAIFTL